MPNTMFLSGSPRLNRLLLNVSVDEGEYQEHLIQDMSDSLSLGINIVSMPRDEIFSQHETLPTEFHRRQTKRPCPQKWFSKSLR
jgi:uncharacterized NAD-dependent epimerase/dehydratase family protein